MIKIEKKQPINVNLTNYILNISQQGTYVDIETTGLSHKSNIISISSLTVEENNYIITQLFSEKEQDQISILKEFINIIQLKKYIITYNGSTFDIPFLKAKFAEFNMPFDINGLISVDLYKYAQNQKYKLNISSLQLKNIEKYFGITRIDTLSGYDITKLYKLYLYNNKREVMDLILKHNLEDITSLPIIFDKIAILHDFIIDSKLLGLIMIDKSSINIKENNIDIKLRCIGHYNINYVIDNKSTYALNYNKESNTLLIKLYTNSAKNKENSIVYLLNDEIYLNSFKSIPILKENIIPIEINKTVIYSNIYKILEKIISNL